jgi:hypothetical protein
MKNLPDLRNDFHLYDAPDPSKIKGIQCQFARKAGLNISQMFLTRFPEPSPNGL